MLSRICRRIRRFIKNRSDCRKKCVQIKRNAVVTADTILQGYNVVHENVLLDSCWVGKASYIGANSHFEQTYIGKYCSIGQNVEVIKGDHPKHMVSTHPSFYSRKSFCGLNYGNDYGFQEYSFISNEQGSWYAIIENDVWLGQGCKIMSGVRIGNGAIVASCALVTKDVPEYAIVAGIPARVIGYRFDDRHREKLTKSQWWNYSDELLVNLAPYFNSPEEFLQRVSK